MSSADIAQRDFLGSEARRTSAGANHSWRQRVCPGICAYACHTNACSDLSDVASRKSVRQRNKQRGCGGQHAKRLKSPLVRRHIHIRC
eukprot:3363348-Rhodomonas_salina.1